MSNHRKRKRRPTIELKKTSGQSLITAQPGQSASAAPKVVAVGYGPEDMHEQQIEHPEDIRALIGRWPVLWINVVGVSDSAFVQKIGDIFLLHELAVEDVMHIAQRAKVELYGEHLFVVLRALSVDEGRLLSEQVSFFLGRDFLITFEERAGGVNLEAVRERLRKGGGYLRSERADYLLYVLIDAVIDGYFPVVESIGDALEKLEDEIVEGSKRETPAQIHDLKRNVLRVRRGIWPARDALSMLMREDTGELFSSRTRLYLRDCYDHAMRVMDLVETQREMCSDLMDLHLSSVSNRMNEVIKILTIVTLVFMPPTLVAGIYGMNFQIPEYHWSHGYLYALVLMIVTSLLVLFAARRKGWLSNDSLK